MVRSLRTGALTFSFNDWIGGGLAMYVHRYVASACLGWWWGGKQFCIIPLPPVRNHHPLPAHLLSLPSSPHFTAIPTFLHLRKCHISGAWMCIPKILEVSSYTILHHLNTPYMTHQDIVQLSCMFSCLLTTFSSPHFHPMCHLHPFCLYPHHSVSCTVTYGQLTYHIVHTYCLGSQKAIGMMSMAFLASHRGILWFHGLAHLLLSPAAYILPMKCSHC